MAKTGQLLSGDGGPSFGDFRKHYAEHNTKAARTQSNEDYLLGLWETYLGTDYKIRKITPQNILAYRQQLLGRGCKPRTANLPLKAMKQLLLLAQTEGHKIGTTDERDIVHNGALHVQLAGASRLIAFPFHQRPVINMCPSRGDFLKGGNGVASQLTFRFSLAFHDQWQLYSALYRQRQMVAQMSHTLSRESHQNNFPFRLGNQIIENLINAANRETPFRRTGPNKYYAAGEIRPGQWIGAGAERLELENIVTRDQFQARCENRNPQNDERLTQRQQKEDKRRVFYDFTCSAPKSISVLAVTLDDERLVTAHEEATRMASVNSKPSLQPESASKTINGTGSLATWSPPRSRARAAARSTRCSNYGIPN